MPKWTTPYGGRALHRDGVHICNLAWPHGTGIDNRPYPLFPHELDALGRRIVALLNAAEPDGALERAWHVMHHAPGGHGDVLDDVAALVSNPRF